jgi:hypothetical protein
MSEMSCTNVATTSRLPESRVYNREKSRSDWAVLVVGAALGSTAIWIGLVVWLCVRAAGSVLA